MLSRLQALYDWLHTHEGRKIFRYSMVSVISTCVSLVVIAIVYGALHLWSEVPSTVFGNVVATFPSYWLNRRWAWGKSGRSHFVKEVLPFWTLAAIGIAFSIVGAAAARHVAIKYNLDHFETTLLVLLAFIRRTTTATGLTVTAVHLERIYPSGVKVSKADFKAIQLTRHEVCPQWNYTIHPRRQKTE